MAKSLNLDVIYLVHQLFKNYNPDTTIQNLIKELDNNLTDIVDREKLKLLNEIAKKNQLNIEDLKKEYLKKEIKEIDSKIVVEKTIINDKEYYIDRQTSIIYDINAKHIGYIKDNTFYLF